MAKRNQPRLRLTDTTFRDGNQTLLGGRLRPAEILPIAHKMDAVGFYAIEAFGGATFETYLSMGEDPWEYLRALRQATPNTPLQALVRGQNLVGHHNYADDAVELFIQHAARCGVDYFRFFDPLNDLRNMEAAIGAARRAKKHVQGALCYAISPVHDLDLWCSLAKGLEELGVNDLVIKDTSGLLSPQATWELVTALRDAVQLPIVIHSHCSSGMAPMAYMAGIEAGAAVVDTAVSPLAWGASQPGTESVVAALAGGDHDTGIDLDKLSEIKDDLERVKWLHAEHWSPFVDRVDADILRYQLPGFMLEQIASELDRHAARERMKEVLEEVPQVRAELGYPPLVAPVRQLIASQAVFNVLGSARYATVTQELKDYLQGLYGRPPKPADPDVRRMVLGRDEPITIRPADLLEPQVERARGELKKHKFEATDDAVLNYLLFPSTTLKFLRGDLAPQQKEKEEPPATADAEPKAEAIAEQPAGEAGAPALEEQPPPAPAATTAEFEVEVEGELFKVRVSGAGLQVAPMPAGGSAPAPAPKAPAREGAVVAPMQGLIVKMPVKKGDEVKLGDVVAVLEAMKMQNDIVTSVAGKVIDVYVKEGEVVSPNQAILSIG